MYMVESKAGAIACMMLSLFFLGTFPALWTLRERRGRLPQHAYLDYSITNFLAAVVFALTLGEIGESSQDRPNFTQLLFQDNFPSVMFAMAGGVAVSIGNLLAQYAWAFVSLSVTKVIASSIVVVLGTTVNYFLDDEINEAKILFPGVACFLIAAFLGSAVHASNMVDNRVKLRSSSVELPNRESAAYSSLKAKPGTADFLVQLEGRRSIKVFGKSTLIGLCLNFFSWANQWHTLKEGVPHLTVYTAFFYLSTSCFFIAVILNVVFLYCPILNLPKTTFKAYLNDRNGRGWALLAGFLCGFGNGLEFMSGQAAGYAAAASCVGQELLLVSTFWGIVLFGEYHKSSRKMYMLLVSTLFRFTVAVGVLMASQAIDIKVGLQTLQRNC